MSADNGVYILATQGDEYVTKSGKVRRKTEFRVAEAQVIDNLFVYPEDVFFCRDGQEEKLPLEPEFAIRTFGKCHVLKDRQTAQGYALALVDSISKEFYVEHGIVYLDCRYQRFPKVHLRLVA